MILDSPSKPAQTDMPEVVKTPPERLQVSTNTGEISGYAACFNQVDLGRDMLLPGAFANVLKRKSIFEIKMLFQHNPQEPIGIWQDIREDGKGLFVRGKLIPQVRKSSEILALIRAGALDGLSIGFKTIKGRTDPKSGVRRLHEVDLWEISIVTFPMQPGARIEALKPPSSVSAPDKPNKKPTLREFERWLTQDAGLTRHEARIVLNTGFKSVPDRQDADRDPNDRLGLAIRRARHCLNFEQSSI